MCLISKTNTPLIAKEDIVCYKVLTKCYFFYITPVIGTIVHPFLCKLFNIPFKAKGNVEIENRYSIFDYNKGIFKKYAITIGFIHTYAHSYLAKHRSCDYDRIFECIIPKGTEYFIDIYMENSMHPNK